MKNKSLMSANYNLNTVNISNTHPIKSKVLLDYLAERKILKLGLLHLKEVECSIDLGKNSFPVVAFKNDEGGFELRNKDWEGYTVPRAITTINGNKDRLNVFENFIDWLSILSYLSLSSLLGETIIILNTLENINSLKVELKKFHSISLYLNNDSSGRKAFNKIKSLHPEVSAMNRILYPNYKCFNDYLRSYFFNVNENLKAVRARMNEK